MKTTATNFFKLGVFKKACAMYQKIVSHFTLKEVLKSNELDDEQSEIYKNVFAELEALHLTVLTNVCVCKAKLADWKAVVNSTAKAFELNSDHPKALFLLGRAHLNMQDYAEAISVLERLLGVDPQNQDARKELTVAKRLLKQHEDKEAKIYSNLFSYFLGE